VRLRWAVPVLFLIAAGGATLATRGADSTWQSIWAGVVTTLVAAAVVDAIALVERSHNDKPVRQMAGRRIGRVHQIVLDMVVTIFDDYQAEARDWPMQLRQVQDRAEDFDTPAKVFPVRTRRSQLITLLALLEDNIDELAGLAAAGVLAREADIVDRALSRSGFLSCVRSAAAGVRWDSGRPIVGDQAAALLEQLQQVLPAAARAAGSTWNYGEWH